MNKPQIIVHSEIPLNYTVFDTKWIPISAKFVALGTNAKGTGAFQIYEITNGQPVVIKEHAQWMQNVPYSGILTTDKISQQQTISQAVGKREEDFATPPIRSITLPYELSAYGHNLKKVEKPKGFKCGTFGAASKHQRFIATGDFEGKLQIWDLERLNTPVYSAKAHSQIINSIDGVGGVSLGGGGAPEVVTGSRDGSVKVWDPRQKEVPVAKMESKDEEDRRDCWAVAFGDSYNNEERCVCAGYDNGDVKLFDLKNMSVSWERNLKNGVCCIEFDRKDTKMNKMVATTLESKFHLFNMETRHPKKGFASLVEKAHNSTVWCVRHLPQNRDVFMTCGGNGSICLWKYEYPEKRYKECDDGTKEGVMGNVNLLQNNIVASQPVASFDWNQDKAGLALCSSFDQMIRVLFVTKLDKV